MHTFLPAELYLDIQQNVNQTIQYSIVFTVFICTSTTHFMIFRSLLGLVELQVCLHGVLYFSVLSYGDAINFSNADV